MATVKPPRRQIATQPLFWLGVATALILPSQLGCRAIRQHVDSRQNIAARKLSREGLEAMHQQQWPEAEELFAEALELNQADDRAHWGIAEALW